MMARIRTIKPDFFMSDDIGSLTVNSRLLYVALWCHSDREGIIKFQRTGLAAQCMPFEFELFDKCITELVEAELITPYIVSGQKYLYIPTFKQHQRPHHTEKDSGYPEFNGEITVKELLDNRKEVEREREVERKGKEGKYMSGRPDYDPKKILEHLNKKTGSAFKPVDSNLKLITARFDEGASEEELIKVIDMKVSEWSGGKMDEYLRPKTLFNATNFNQYVGELAKWEKDHKRGNKDFENTDYTLGVEGFE